MPGSNRSKGNFSVPDESLSWTETWLPDSFARGHSETVLTDRTTVSTDRNREVLERALPGTLPIYHQQDVSLGRKIAEGGQGVIYEARLALPYSFKHEPVAVKKFKDLGGISQGHFPPQLWEYKCSHVCKPRGVFVHYEKLQTISSLCVVMDRYSSDLRSLIDSKVKGNGPPFPLPVAVCIITQIALGMRGLHEFGIYHRDLKASNILVQKNANSLLTLGTLDMNFSVVIADFEASEDVQGTGFWRAPEVLQSLINRVKLSGNQWQAADVYSFSMTCYEILTGKTPFEGLRWGDYKVVLSGERPKLPAYVPEPLKGIIERV